jgi:hypothetical protein
MLVVLYLLLGLIAGARPFRYYTLSGLSIGNECEGYTRKRRAL